MKKLIAYYGDSPVYAEGFSENCKRSCEGAVHLLPRKPVTVTDDEYEHILKKYSWMKPKLKVLAEMKEEGSKAEAAAPVEEQAAVAQPGPASDQSSAEAEKKASSGDQPKKKK